MCLATSDDPMDAEEEGGSSVAKGAEAKVGAACPCLIFFTEWLSRQELL